ncbi:nuclear transport factor 2 family protein [Fulvivirga ulvae]|uniref:nuclear transport factor 2 family protein n=1 Tax=Fulvivirga ulvae TaxID=2904245 RepID=UPI001F3B45B1|nr:nuclear transport factor 2 family protein [Fulvivirga ulvae]UII34564.1 nuclear transport factor 2 family protein [Fulvivirga ulvae]
MKVDKMADLSQEIKEWQLMVTPENNMSKTEIIAAFSNGLFEKTFEYLSENATWEVVGENYFNGKEAIIRNCREVENYFRTVTTRFETFNIIEDGHKVAVNGSGEFIRDGLTVSYVQACDVYLFDDQGLIRSITSYCIQTSKPGTK